MLIIALAAILAFGQCEQPGPAAPVQVKQAAVVQQQLKPTENVVEVDTSDVSEGVESCACEAIEKCLAKGSSKCWRGAYGGLYPPVITECENSFNDSFKYIDNQMRKCLDRNALNNVCSYVRTSQLPESIKRKRREMIFGKEENSRKKREAGPGETEKHKENMDGLLNAMNENKANQLPHEEDKDNKQEQAVKQKFFDAAQCWDHEESICYNSHNQKCGITKDILATIDKCEKDEGIQQLEHTLGVRVSVCVQERLVHAGLQCYFSKLSADENARKEKEAAEKADAKAGEAKPAGSGEAKPAGNANPNPIPNVNPNVNPNVSANVNPNLNQNVNPNVNQNVNQNVNSNVNSNAHPNPIPAVNQNVNSNVNSNAHPNPIPAVNQNVYPNVNTAAKQVVNNNNARRG